MALPKRRISTRRKGKRRSGKGLKLPTLVRCPHCQAWKPPHQSCPSCGRYQPKDEEPKRS